MSTAAVIILNGLALKLACAVGGGKKAALMRILNTLDKPASADEIWGIAQKLRDVDLRSKTFMKRLLVQLREESLVKTVPSGEQNYGYKLSEHYRHLERRRKNLEQKQMQDKAA